MVSVMNWSQGGDFTKSLLSLQLQLQTLLEGVGGDETAGLLDSLAKLTDSERALIIPILTKALGKILEGQLRLKSTEDLKLAEFEDNLFESVIAAMKGENTDQTKAGDKAQKNFAVVAGGKRSEKGDVVAFKKPVRSPALIDLSKARETRKVRPLDGNPPEIA